MKTLAEVFAQMLSDSLELPVSATSEIVSDLRLMDEDIDDAFDDERLDPEADARKLYENLTSQPKLVRWFEKRAKVAREGLERPFMKQYERWFDPKPASSSRQSKNTLTLLTLMKARDERHSSRQLLITVRGFSFAPAHPRLYTGRSSF